MLAPSAARRQRRGLKVGPRQADLLSAAFWAVLGALIFAAAWRMDRLTHQGITVWSAPGLLPGAVGLLMVVFALVLAVQARRGPMSGAAGTAPEVANTSAAGWRQSALAALLCLVFAGFSLGRGLPFQLEAALFIVLFTAVFRWREWRESGRAARGLVQAGVVAAVAAFIIGWLFESVFLVRLP